MHQVVIVSLLFENLKRLNLPFLEHSGLLEVLNPLLFGHQWLKGTKYLSNFYRTILMFFTYFHYATLNFYSNTFQREML